MMLLALVACFGMSPGTSEPVAAVITEGGSQAHDTVDGTRIKADLAAIRGALKLYPQLHDGEQAPDLASLELTGLSYPDRYTYDASAGTVSDPDHPGW